MWINAFQVKEVLNIGLTYAYKVIKDLKEELKEKGYFVNPTCQVPIAYFCERFKLDVDEVKEAVKDIKRREKDRCKHVD